MSPDRRSATTARRLGDDFQDVIGIEYLVSMLRDPMTVRWVSYEEREAGSLDDILVGYADGIEYIQAKYTVEPDEWSLADLLKSEAGGGRSLLQKWAVSWRRVCKSGPCRGVIVQTRRHPAANLAAILDGGTITGRIFTEATLASVKDRLLAHLSEYAFTHAELRSFLLALRFRYGEPDIEEVISRAKRSFLGLGASEGDWHSLLAEVRLWTRYKLPSPDGRIRVNDVRKAAKLWEPERLVLPQDFSSDPRVFVRHVALRHALQDRFDARASGCLVLQGAPGSGKSSFLTWLARAPRPGFRLTLLHHFFVGLDDETAADRLDAVNSAKSLLAMISGEARAVLSRPENPQPKDLAQWLREIAKAAHTNGERILLVIDGLDHLVRERDLAEVRKFLRWLPAPVPAGLWIVLGTQPMQRLLPATLERSVVSVMDMPGFDAGAVADYLEAYFGSRQGDAVISAALQRSEGNPLYLQYLVEFIKGSKTGLTPLTIEHAPPFGGSIEAYYLALWRGLESNVTVSSGYGASGAQSLLAVAGWANFSFPRDDLDYFALRLNVALPVLNHSIQQVQHLLSGMHLEAGEIRLYHDSLRRFIRERAETQVLKCTALESLFGWLRERADEGTRWHSEWEYELYLGNPSPLLKGISREWATAALGAHRSHRRLRELLRLGIRTAAEQGDVASALRIGWLKSYVDEAIEDRNGNLGILLRASLRLGLHERVRSALEQNNYDGPSLVALGRTAYLLGYADLADNIATELSGSTTPDTIDAAYESLAYARAEGESIIGHYLGHMHLPLKTVHSSAREDWRQVFSCYLRGLVAAERRVELRRLADSDRLDSIDRSAACDALVRLSVRARNRVWIEEAIANVVPPSEYAQVAARLAGTSITAGRDDRPLIARDPNEHRADYFRREGWDRTHAEVMWRAVNWCLVGRLVDVETEMNRLQQGTLHERLHAHLLRFAIAVFRSITGHENLDLRQLVHDFAGVGRPIYPTEKDYGIWRTAIEGWLRRLTLALELLVLTGNNPRIESDHFLLLWDSAIGREEVLSWLEAEAHRWVPAEERERLSERLELIVRQQLVPFGERSTLFALLASVSALYNLGNVDQLMERSASNSLGHGYHKDMVLYQVMETVGAARSARYDSGETSLLSLTPIIDAIGDLTDNDEMSYLYLDLVGHLIDYNSPWGLRLIHTFFERQDYYRMDRSVAVYVKHADPEEPVALALAHTLTDPEVLNETKEFLERRLQKLTTNQRAQAAEAETQFYHWLQVECPPGVREEQAYRQLGEGEQSAPPNVTSGRDLLKWLGSQEPSWEDRWLPTMLQNWAERPHELTLPEATDLGNSLLALDPLWTELGVYEALHEILWAHGLRDLAFRALMSGQIGGHGWTSYWTAKSKSDARLRTVLDRYPDRAFEYILRSTFVTGEERGGLSTTARVVDALARAGYHDLAVKIARDFVAFAQTLSGDLELPDPDWLKAESGVLEPIDLLLQRLKHISVAARTRAARAVADLIRVAPAVMDRVLQWLQHEPLELHRCNGLSAISELAATTAELVVPYLDRLRGLAGESSLMFKLMFNDLCDLCDRTDLRFRAEEYASSSRSWATASEASAVWYDGFLRTWPAYADRMGRAEERIRNFRSLVIQDAELCGLDERRIEESKEARSAFYSYANHSATFLSPPAMDVVESSFLRALSFALSTNAVDVRNALTIALDGFPIDSSLRRLSCLPRPPWLSQARGESGQLTTWPAQSTSAVGQQFGWPTSNVFVPLAMDAMQVQKDGSMAWRSTVIGFSYKTVGALPEPRDVFRKISRQIIYCDRLTTRVLDFLEALSAGPSSGPFDANGLQVIPLVGRLALLAGFWELLANLPWVFVPFVESSLIRGLVPLKRVPLSYGLDENSGSPILRGEFWQDGMISDLHFNDAAKANCGYVFNAASDFMLTFLKGTGWPLGWVRRTAVAAREGYKNKWQTTESFDFLNVSRIIIG